MSLPPDEAFLPLARSGGQSVGLALLLVLGYALAAMPVLASLDTVATALPALVLASGLLALSIIDATTFRLPDLITLPLLAAGLVIALADGTESLAVQSMSAAVAGAGLLAVGALYRSLRGNDGLGLGDAKLFAAGGAWIAPAALASALLVACGAALAYLALRAGGRHALDRTSAIPFGPFLAFGLWIAWLYGPLA